MSLRVKFESIMRKKIKFNRDNGKAVYSYAHIDDAVLDALEKKVPLNLVALGQDASRRYGKSIPQNRVRPHVCNKESNAINNWLAKDNMEIVSAGGAWEIIDHASGKRESI